MLCLQWGGWEMPGSEGEEKEMRWGGWRRGRRWVGTLRKSLEVGEGDKIDRGCNFL